MTYLLRRDTAHLPAAHPQDAASYAARRRPKILLIQTQAENAGAQEVARLLAAGLARCGFDTAQAFFFRRTDAFDAAPGTSFCADARPRGPLGTLRLLFHGWQLVRQTRPDLVMTFQHYGNVIGAPLARLGGVRHVVANQTTTLTALHPAIRFADRLLGRVGAYDAVVINSDATHHDHAAYPRSYRDRIVHIPHGFEQKTSRLPKAEARRAFDLRDDITLLGGVGRLHPSKNWEAVIRLLPTRPLWHFANVGQGSDGERLHQLSQSLGCADRVHFLGEVAPSRIGTFLAGLDVFVFPTLAETFGLAAVEAAQAGVPVVANRLRVLEEVLRVDGEPCAVFADANDPAAFAAAIDTVLADPAASDALTARARMLDGVYGLDTMVEGYAAMIDRLLARTPATRAGGKIVPSGTPA